MNHANDNNTINLFKNSHVTYTRSSNEAPDHRRAILSTNSFDQKNRPPRKRRRRRKKKETRDTYIHTEGSAPSKSFSFITAVPQADPPA